MKLEIYRYESEVKRVVKFYRKIEKYKSRGKGKASDLRESLSGADLSRMTGAKSVKLVLPFLI